MNQPLIPTPVVDKNGRLTTVHKRNDLGASSDISIPAPIVAIPEQPSKKKLVGKLADRIDDILCLDDPEQKDYLVENLTEYDHDFLVKLDGLGDSWLAATLVNDHEPAIMINETLAFVDGIKAYSTPDAIDLVRTLHSYPLLGKYRDYSLAPQEVQDQCVRLLRVADAMRCHSSDNLERGLRILQDDELDDTRNPSLDSSYLLSDERMIQGILDDPAFADRAITVIKERGTSHYDAIVAVLNHEQVALSDGVL